MQTTALLWAQARFYPFPPMAEKPQPAAVQAFGCSRLIFLEMSDRYYILCILILDTQYVLIYNLFKSGIR